MRDELNDMNYLMKNLMDGIEDNIYFKDREGRFIMFSRYCARWFGFDSPEDLVGKTDFDIFSSEHAKEAFEDEQRIMETGEPLLRKEEKETWEDGHTTWVSSSKMPLYDKHCEIIGTFGISRDITDRKTAEIKAARYAAENQLFRDQVERELQIAGQLQKTFFPTTYPVFPEGVPPAQSCIQFFHRYHASTGVGGDFCSIRKISETKAGILLCDVMGHGVRAALIASLIRGLVEELSGQENDPGRYLDRLNKTLLPILVQEDEILFATACYMVINTSTGELQVANAGHPSPLILSGQEAAVEPLFTDPGMRGPALAMNTDDSYRTAVKTLSPNDTVIMFTDGIYEAENSSREEFGENRLMESVSRHAALPLPDLFAALLDEARMFSEDEAFEDDICLVGFSLRDGD